MTHDDILKWSLECGAWKTDTGELIKEDMNITKFAAFVAAHTRKELADEFAGLGEWACVHIIEAIDS